jgi:hypothetical protein
MRQRGREIIWKEQRASDPEASAEAIGGWDFTLRQDARHMRIVAEQRLRRQRRKLLADGHWQVWADDDAPQPISRCVGNIQAWRLLWLFACQRRQWASVGGADMREREVDVEQRR